MLCLAEVDTRVMLRLIILVRHEYGFFPESGGDCVFFFIL